MQNKPSNDQHKNIYYRLRRSDPHERLSARLRHFSFGAAVFFVVAAAGIVTHSLYNIQIRNGETYRQLAAGQHHPGHPRRDLRCLRHHAGVHQRSMDHLGRPQLQHGPLH